MPPTPIAQEPTLNRLVPGQCGTILALDAAEELHQRLVALGLGIGNSVRLLRRARFGGPLHVRVGCTELMLRVREAACIRITHDTPTDARAD
jgi:ferrous iron transport protein A